MNSDSHIWFQFLQKTCVIPSDANVLDYKCGWHHAAPVLYMPPTIEFIAPDAFRAEKTFVTPATNEQNLREILKSVKFAYRVITI